MADRAPHNMTANNAPEPYVASASSYFPDSPPYFQAWCAFDGGIGTNQYWIATASTGWLKIDLGSGNSFKIGSYAIQANTIPEPNRMPQNWTLQGSNDNSTWDTLDTVTGEISWGNGEKREYTCNVVTTAYRYFKIDITLNNGDANYTVIAEMFLYEAAGSASLSPSVSPSLSPSISPSMSPSLSPSASLSPSISPSISPSVSPSVSPSISPSAGAVIEGTTCWGHVTGVLETNVRTFASNWTGTGAVENSGDAERLALNSSEYMEGEVVNTGTKTVQLLQNNYQAGDTVVLKYRHGLTEAACLLAVWNTYSSPFVSLGYVQVRVEATA